MEQGYKENIIRNQIEKVDNLERTTLLNNNNAVRKNVIPFSVAYSPTLPNIREIINKHWHILNINNTLGNVFKATPVIIAFRKNTSLRQIICTNTISHNQKLLKVKHNVTKGECIPCNPSRCLSCQQLTATTIFESIQKKKDLTYITKFLVKGTMLFTYQNVCSAKYGMTESQKLLFT